MKKATESTSISPTPLHFSNGDHHPSDNTLNNYTSLQINIDFPLLLILCPPSLEIDSITDPLVL